MTANPITRFVKAQGVVLLDGGLATTLEANGHDLRDALWSARLLLDAPEAIREVHRRFLEAGADVITTATYQATVPGFAQRGLSDSDARDLLVHAVDLAIAARDAFWSEPANRSGRRRPLVAASVGPYGAFLADGSEFTGRYGIGETELYAFHQDRWHVLAASRADLLACETIPSRVEAQTLLRLMREVPDRWAWLSVSCRDGAHLSDGTPVADVTALSDAEPGLAAIGINCTSPTFVPSLVSIMRSATRKPIIVYPNSGETYDAAGRKWVGTPVASDWVRLAAGWPALGVDGVGGCCRIGPERIAELRHALVG